MSRRSLPMLLLLCSAATAAAQAPSAAPDAGAPAPAAEPQPLPKAELDKLLAETDAIAKTVSDLRGLPIKRPIQRGVLSKDEITRRLIARIDQDFAPGEILAEERALKRLGLLPPSVDYRELELAILSEQIAGFYDPQVRELYIADWIETDKQRMVMAHEIDHALQDQTFNLLRFMKPNRENSDEALAKQALVEGDGVALMIEFMMREMGQKLDPWASDAIVDTIAALSGMPAGKHFDEAPLALRESLLFPYIGGLRFIAASRRTRPWSDVDAMYARPPASTEQVLHPAKYRSGEKPVAVKTAPLSSLKGWKRTYFNVVGELLFAVFLRQHGVDKPRADKAAAGWGGDHIALFSSPEDANQTVAVVFSTWDAEADAVEAAEALTASLPSLTGSSGKPADAPGSGVDAAGNITTVERKGRDVLLVVGAPPAVEPKLRAEVWAKWKAGK